MANADTEGRAGLSALVAAHRDPHAHYDRARAGGGFAFDPLAKCWLVTGHAAVRSVLEDERFTSDLSAGMPAAPQRGGASFVQSAIRRQIIFSDGEEHRRVQNVILRVSSRNMQAMAEGIRALAHRLLEGARARGALDLVKDFSLPYSLETICATLGVPADDPARLEELERWSTTFANVTSGYLHVRVQDITLLGDFFREQVAARRRNPSDDLIGTMLRERTFDDDEDLVINCMAVFAAGRVTTQKLLGDGIPLLMPEWGRWRELALGNPAVCRRLAEELLRVVTPTRYVARAATEEVEPPAEYGAERPIGRGERVILFLEAANRDPARFPEPHSLVAERQPNPHLAFGHGRHRCPGASIARVEIHTALEVLFATFAELRPHPSAPPSWDPNPNLGGFASYPCLCG